jgi:hypothetical protein
MSTVLLIRFSFLTYCCQSDFLCVTSVSKDSAENFIWLNPGELGYCSASLVSPTHACAAAAKVSTSAETAKASTTAARATTAAAKTAKSAPAPTARTRASTAIQQRANQ